MQTHHIHGIHLDQCGQGYWYQCAEVHGAGGLWPRVLCLGKIIFPWQWGSEAFCPTERQCVGVLSPQSCAVVSIRMTLLLEGHQHEKFLFLSPIRQLFETSRKVCLLTDREQLSPSIPPGPCLPSTLTSGNQACSYSECCLCGLIKPGKGDPNQA